MDTNPVTESRTLMPAYGAPPPLNMSRLPSAVSTPLADMPTTLSAEVSWNRIADSSWPRSSVPVASVPIAFDWIVAETGSPSSSMPTTPLAPITLPSPGRPMIASTALS